MSTYNNLALVNDDIFVATLGETTYDELKAAYESGLYKTFIAKEIIPNGSINYEVIGYFTYYDPFTGTFYFASPQYNFTNDFFYTWNTTLSTGRRYSVLKVPGNSAAQSQLDTSKVYKLQVSYNSTLQQWMVDWVEDN